MEHINCFDKHHVVCGMGHVGFRVASILLKIGIKTVVIYDQAPTKWVNEISNNRGICIQGDARDIVTLRSAKVDTASMLIVATDHDLTNVTIAIEAQLLNPAIGIVLRLYDTCLAPHLATQLKLTRVLSASALAAPAFTAAAFGEETLGIFLQSNQLYGLVVKKQHGGESLPKDGSATNAISSPCHDSLKVTRIDLPSAGKVDKSLLSMFWGRVRARFQSHTRTIIFSLIFLVASSVLLFHWLLDLDFIDALYFSITTITTTGYGDISLLKAPWAVKLFGCILMLAGAAVAGAAFSTFTDFLISKRLPSFWTRHAVSGSNHCIITGEGNVFSRLIEELSRYYNRVVVICSDRAVISSAVKNAIFIEGDARSETLLKQAGIEQASCIISAFDDDIRNLGVVLSARKINPEIRTIARAFDHTLAQQMQRPLGIDKILSVSAAAAPAFVAASLGYDFKLAAMWGDTLAIVHSSGSEAHSLLSIIDNVDTLSNSQSTFEPESDKG